MNTIEKPKILIVEDESDVSNFLLEALEQDGYTVSHEADGLLALKKILSEKFDLIVLDIALPSMDGFEILKKVRQTIKTPVLILTARRKLEDRVEGLEAGADDYLLKPFELAEFTARVRAILRRSELSRGTIEYKDLWMDPLSRKVKRGNRNVYLSNTEFALLEILCRNPESTVSKKDMLDTVWENSSAKDMNLVEVYIGYLRTKLESGDAKRLIHTVRGVGYRLADLSFTH